MNIFLILFIISICESTLFWRINVNPPAYLLGTAHLPYSSLWPSISDEAKSAFSDSTHFLPEFDMTNFLSFTRFRACMDGFTNIPKAQSPSTKMAEKAWSIFDVYLTREARRLRKNVTGLESAEMYCEFTKFQINMMLSNLTTNINSPTTSSSTENEFDLVKRIYNCDLNCPSELLPNVRPFIFDEKLIELKQRLDEIVGRRDNKMTQMIDSLIKTNPSNSRYFFAVGFIHLLAGNGIIDRLRQDYNYSVTRLCTDSQHFRSALNCQGPSWCDTNNYA